jgi:hypothetical protein
MKRNNKSYPYPVLGIGDDILPRPTFTVEPVVADSDYYYVSVKIEMDNKDIAALIDNGYAEYGCEVECSRTFYMKWFGFKTPAFTIALPRHEVAEKVSFDCRVSVVKDISGYVNSGAHEDYEGMTFTLPAGSVLALFGKFNYNADIQYDKLHSAGAFITIIEGNDSENTTYTLDHSKIEVKLPPALFKEYKEKYNKRASKWADVFHSSIAFNALVYAIFSYNEDIHKDLLWAKTLDYRINLEPSLHCYKEVMSTKTPSDVMGLAQALLGNPYKRMFKTIGTLNEQMRAANEDYDTGL